MCYDAVSRISSPKADYHCLNILLFFRCHFLFPRDTTSLTGGGKGPWLCLTFQNRLRRTLLDKPVHWNWFLPLRTCTILFIYCFFFFKERGTSTEPPPRANFSATANQVELEYTPYHYYTKIHCPFVTFTVFDIVPFQINIKAFFRSLCCFSKKKWAPCLWLAPCLELAP